MADDFARLVFQANPASSHWYNSQYQHANHGPLSASPHDSQLLDPFFDNEDEGDPPGSTFASARPMYVKESKSTLARPGCTFG